MSWSGTKYIIDGRLLREQNNGRISQCDNDNNFIWSLSNISMEITRHRPRQVGLIFGRSTFYCILCDDRMWHAVASDRVIEICVFN